MLGTRPQTETRRSLRTNRRRELTAASGMSCFLSVCARRNRAPGFHIWIRPGISGPFGNCAEQQTFLAFNQIYYPADPDQAHFQKHVGETDLWISGLVSWWRRTLQRGDGRHGSHSLCSGRNNAKWRIINHILSHTRCPTFCIISLLIRVLQILATINKQTNKQHIATCRSRSNSSVWWRRLWLTLRYAGNIYIYSNFRSAFRKKRSAFITENQLLVKKKKKKKISFD